MSSEKTEEKRKRSIYEKAICVPGIFLHGLFLLLAILCTGVGAAMSLNMRLIPNPGDGIVQALSDLFGKGVGITKNVFDLCNICFTLCVGFLFAGKPIGIGLGTVLSMIGVGRVIAAFNHLFRKRMLELAGVEK